MLLQVSSLPYSLTTKNEYTFGDKNSDLKVAVLDLGCKKSILKNFSERDVFPRKWCSTRHWRSR